MSTCIVWLILGNFCVCAWYTVSTNGLVTNQYMWCNCHLLSKWYTTVTMTCFGHFWTVLRAVCWVCCQFNSLKQARDGLCKGMEVPWKSWLKKPVDLLRGLGLIHRSFLEATWATKSTNGNVEHTMKYIQSYVSWSYTVYILYAWSVGIWTYFWGGPPR